MTDTSKATGRPLAEKPWAWERCYEMEDGHMHWALVSPSQRDCGVGDGHNRVVGLILLDHWSSAPDRIMEHALGAVNNYDRLQTIENLAGELLQALNKASIPLVGGVEVEAKRHELQKLIG